VETSPVRTGTGMILGKFMPPHLGHVYGVEFARRFVARLTVLVCSLEREPIPGPLRFTWMRELFPDCDVRHVTDENPQEPHEHPDFWRIWHATIRRALPTGPDFVFASEPYGAPLAEVLGAKFIPIDLRRDLVPISGTAIRRAPLRHWEFLPPPVRPYYVKRVCVFGPESTGKTTLAADLARHFRTAWAGEFARGLLDPKAGRCDPEDIPLIARGQLASEDALARQANRVLFCDTDLITTTIWSRVLFGDCPRWIEEEADRRRYDLYLLLDVDVPWVDDSQRYLPHLRREFFERCRDELSRRGRRAVTISGTWPERFTRAVAAVETLLDEAPAAGR
jgi:HTH-type transcriptional regulator, transcriptional repressor of NAD biosynthesis genes